jgi:hypothetical protein
VTESNRIADAVEGAEVLAGTEDHNAHDPGREREFSAADENAETQADEPELGQDGKLTREPRPLGFDMGEMNRDYALVLQGSKAVIYMEQPNAPVEDQQRVLTLEAFHAWHANRYTEIVDRGTGKIKAVNWSQRWIKHPRRRQFKGIEFYPDPKGEGSTPGYLNLWSGFAFEPDAQTGSYAVFRDHLLTNVCGGSKALYAWVFAFFAQMLQRPRERIGVAIVMRGAMGSGKSIVGEVMGRLVPRHYFMVDDPRYVTGQFNAHMASCLLLQADEAVWAGDKAAEGRLKGLITSPMQQIEAKGVDPIRLKNFVRLIMTSNEDWVVPAGKDERRFCVLDVAPHCAQNHAYFKEMHDELDAGGYCALLADLLSFDLASVNLRQIPRTDGLLEQKIRSFNPVEAWWYRRLEAGATTKGRDVWRTPIPTSTLYSDFLEDAERVGIRRKSWETEFGIALRKLIPGLIRRRETIYEEGEGYSSRPWCYVLPDLAECREHFASLLQQEVHWPPIVDDER